MALWLGNKDNTWPGDYGADNTGPDVVHGEGGDDVISGGNKNDKLFGENNDDYLNGGSGNDDLFGGNNKDTLYGGVNDDRLYGENGEDDLSGESGKDKLYGGIGNDTLHGGTGNDTLTGGVGKDALYGDSGNDTFVYTLTSQSPVGAPDTIHDFESTGDNAVGNDDTIDLSGIDANTNKPDGQAFNWYWESNSDPGSGAQKLWFDTNDHILYGDVNGGDWDFAIKLPGVTAATLDFIMGPNDFIA